jgi:aldose 1-epimerase
MRSHVQVLSVLVPLILSLGSATANNTNTNSNSNSSSSSNGNGNANANANGIQPYTLYAQGINATFIPHGARMTSLFVSDRNGAMRDVAVGYDDLAEYPRDTATNRTFFGAIVG